ncbi:MAG: hypothetical protein NC132_06455 [Corallococcus sp.]|nr:hypothetical protein [Corallococcus sp.]MCM1395725.1 hypothetical protein [Corallococcus sp.]
MPKALFNITYTTPNPPKNYTGQKRADYLAERNFYNLSADYNYFTYILNGQKVEKNKNAESYFTRTGSGLFGFDGEFSEQQIAALKERLKNTQSIIWHGFISFDQLTSMGFTSMEQAEKFIKQTFGAFLSKTHLKKDNVELFAALHTDHPHHNHIHFAFFEKEPKHRDKNGILSYTKKGTIPQKAIDNYMVSANLYLDERADEYYTARDAAMDKLKDVRSDVAKGIRRDMRLNMAIDNLIAQLPKNGRLQYNSENMAALRPEIDKVAKMLINSDSRTRESHIEVLKQFGRIEQSIQALVKENKIVYVDNRRLRKDEIKEIEEDKGQNLTKSVDVSNIDYLPNLKKDYNARLGNIVLGLCKEIIKGNYKERKSNAQANKGRAKLASRRQHEWRGHLLQNALTSIVLQDERLQMNFLKTVQQIENEMKYSDGIR